MTTLNGDHDDPAQYWEATNLSQNRQLQTKMTGGSTTIPLEPVSFQNTFVLGNLLLRPLPNTHTAYPDALPSEAVIIGLRGNRHELYKKKHPKNRQARHVRCSKIAHWCKVFLDERFSGEECAQTAAFLKTKKSAMPKNHFPDPTWQTLRILKCLLETSKPHICENFDVPHSRICCRNKSRCPTALLAHGFETSFVEGFANMR